MFAKYKVGGCKLKLLGAWFVITHAFLLLISRLVIWSPSHRKRGGMALQRLVQGCFQRVYCFIHVRRCSCVMSH